MKRSSQQYGELVRLLGEANVRSLGLYPVPDDFVLSVVIPVYNELKTVENVIQRVRAVDIQTEIICVNDGSTDGSRELLDNLAPQYDLVVVHLYPNQGKGAALREGFMRATGDAVIVQDADLEYDPADFPKLVRPIVENRADVVYGSRFIGEEHRVLYFWHSLGNRLLTLLSNMFTDLNLTDMETGYKVFRREVIQQIAPRLRESRFGIEPELTARVSRLRGTRVYELPISYSGRTYAEGKKIGWRDGVSALRCIITYGLGLGG